MSKHKLSLFLPIIIAFVLAIGIFLGVQLNQPGGNFPFFKSKKTDKVKEVMDYIRENYVDTLTAKVVTEKTIESMLQSLDPHSNYIPAIDYHETLDPLLGSFEGIGVQFRIESDTIMVVTPISGGPSEKVGIRAGDRIVRVDGKKVAGVKITNNDVMRKLKGPKGTEVKVTIFRRGVRGLTDYTIIRDVIPTFSVDVSYMANSNVGYIRLNTFSATTHEETANAIVKLKKEGMTKLILDLRGNGGGYLQAAIGVADEFLAGKKLIVYTEGAHRPKDYSYASSDGIFEQGDLVVLVDEWSASASEIVAGAIQDNDRGTIVGRRSFGKGLVQEQLMFGDSSFVRLTVARYFTPTGRCIQKPYNKGADAYYNDHFERYLNGEMMHPDSIHFADSLKFKTPGGKVVYGGGGIMPDVYVPFEIDSTLKFYNLMVNKGIIYQFAFDYTDANRPRLQKFKNFGEYNRYFQVDDKIYSDFLAFANKKGFKHEGNNLSTSDQKTKVLLKAYIGRNILDNNAFYPLLNSIDPVFLKAVNVLNGKK